MEAHVRLPLLVSSSEELCLFLASHTGSILTHCLSLFQRWFLVRTKSGATQDKKSTPFRTHMIPDRLPPDYQDRSIWEAKSEYNLRALDILESYALAQPARGYTAAGMKDKRSHANFYFPYTSLANALICCQTFSSSSEASILRRIFLRE